MLVFPIVMLSVSSLSWSPRLIRSRICILSSLLLSQAPGLVVFDMFPDLFSYSSTIRIGGLLRELLRM